MGGINELTDDFMADGRAYQLNVFADLKAQLSTKDGAKK